MAVHHAICESRVPGGVVDGMQSGGQVWGWQTGLDVRWTLTWTSGSMTTLITAVATVAKVNFFNSNEEKQLARSVVIILQDPIQGNQQKENAFLITIADHYDSNRPGDSRPRRSLETKLDLIKHNI